MQWRQGPTYHGYRLQRTKLSDATYTYFSITITVKTVKFLVLVGRTSLQFDCQEGEKFGKKLTLTHAAAHVSKN